MLSKMASTARLHDLRQVMNNSELVEEPLSAYLIPSRDAHGNCSYFAAPCDQRISFVSGFSGVAGVAVVTSTKALLWVDSRYHFDDDQVDAINWSLVNNNLQATPTPAQWINKELQSGSVIGVDPSLINFEDWSKISVELESGGNRLVAVATNLVDQTWKLRPKRPNNPVSLMGVKFTGKTISEKLIDIRNEMRAEGVEYLVMSDLEEISWLLNCTGNDLPYSHVFFAFCIVGVENVELFMDGRNNCGYMLEGLTRQTKITFHKYSDVRPYLESLMASGSTGGKFWLGTSASYLLTSAIPESRRVLKSTPVAIMKSIKNHAEIQGMADCNLRDAVAVCKFFGWLEGSLYNGDVITESIAVAKLEEYRKNSPLYLRSCFPPVTSVGWNNATLHQNLQVASSFRSLSSHEMFMIDSGGHYMDGITDFARTIHFGVPSSTEKQCYTMMLKETIRLVLSSFPDKPKNPPLKFSLDHLNVTRQSSSINVHDGPSNRKYPDSFLIQENMYLNDKFLCYYDLNQDEQNIRLENVIRVIKESESNNFGNPGSLTFENVTLVPYQQKMIEYDLLSELEITYIDGYQKMCSRRLKKNMDDMGIQPDDPGYLWLLKETEPLQGTPAPT